MNPRDKDKYKRLVRRIESNYKITRLLAEYLERFPELITNDMVNALTEDGRISREEALVAILSEVFGLDFDNGEDRILIRDYLVPSIRLLDAEKYRQNPYYKNIKIPDAKDGGWELRTESYEPYRAVICGDMIFGDDFIEVPPLGFFTEKFYFPAVLEDGNEWMTLTPVDLDTSDEAILAAKGKVVTFGLGLGYYTYMVSEKDSVESITVVERSPDVIKLFKEHILPQFSHPEKVKIVMADAFEYAEKIMPDEHFDLAFVDTWRDASDGAPMYRKMRALEHLSPDTKFLYWIEGFLISRCRAENFVQVEENFAIGKYESFDEILTDYLK